MAGDWIKMRVDLGDDPAVVRIASGLDMSEDEVVGKLHRLWSWADRHTTDGTAPAITPKWVDRYVGCAGFAEAMVKSSWISFSEDGVLFPHFDRHNGDSAKRRGEAAIRQRLSRKNRDEGVTGIERTAIPRPFARHVMVRDNYTCVYCGTESTAKQEEGRRAILSIDHITPITRGGSAAVENLVCACRVCNSEKNDRTPSEWGVELSFLQPGVVYTGSHVVSQKTRDKEVTREEKRREEFKSLLAAAHGDESGEGAEVQAKATKASRLSADWELPADWLEWAMREFPGWTAQHVSRMADRFKDYWIAKPGKDATKTNWHATWRNWVRNEADRNPPKTPPAANQNHIFKACI